MALEARKNLLLLRSLLTHPAPNIFGFLPAAAAAAEVPGAFLCLAIDSLRIGAEVRYESATPVGDKPAMTGDQLTAAAEQLFPHIYGPLPREAVMAELAVTRSEDGTFLAIEGAEARTA